MMPPCRRLSVAMHVRLRGAAQDRVRVLDDEGTGVDPHQHPLRHTLTVVVGDQWSAGPRVVHAPSIRVTMLVT